MSERVEKLDVDVVWEPNVPEAYLLVGDFGDVVLALNAHDRISTPRWWRKSSVGPVRR